MAVRPLFTLPLVIWDDAGHAQPVAMSFRSYSYVRFARETTQHEPLILDTNVIIDGRIADLARLVS